ncbi:hypothetical protein EV188_101656 [Actinomycetospora succinea]|uniref:Uncharacterized protein n=1 Tax=Actinomycetospora succinea TaxID=663603 RepID=A0A4R6VS16_9PSEU|nr:hypothetical protein [Actinomycetospora succinea]TDQ65406.1 hypothetical protein EV188_101656 [Actinomycetospora succinea]
MPRDNGSPQQRRFVRLIVAAGLVGALFMSLAMTNTFSAFVATITNTNDTAATGSLILQETGATGTTACNSTDGGGVSTNTATCATFNKYGGNTAMLPSNAAGTTNNVTTLVNFKNTGTAAATAFTMGFGPCTQSAAAGAGTATDFCSKLHVKVTSGATVVQADTVASTLAGTTVNLPAALIPAANSGSTIPLTFTTYVDVSAGNTYQGLTASQPITWTLTG